MRCHKMRLKMEFFVRASPTQIPLNATKFFIYGAKTNFDFSSVVSIDALEEDCRVF